MRDVAPGLIQIDEPHAHEFVRGNIWWRQGENRDLIVDTGLGISSLKAVIREATVTQGRRWREPIVVLTHGHLDHAGGAAEFDDVRAHPDDVPAAVTSLHGPTFTSQLGLPADASVPSGWLVTASPQAEWDPGLHDVGDIVTVPLRAGEIIDLGDRTYEVLHLPGHTHGSIALFDHLTGELFSGDVVYDDDLLDTLLESDIPAYRESMQRLCELAVETVRPGHGDSFGRQTLHRIARTYLRGTSNAGLN